MKTKAQINNNQFIVYSLMSLTGMVISHFIPTNFFSVWVLISLLIGHLINVRNYKTMSNKLTDLDAMPWGKYKGDDMQNVPASYLLYMYEQGKCDGIVKAYIEDNLEVLNHEVENQ